MIVARSLEEIRHYANTVVTVGSFDGVHRAHQEILREVVQRARMGEGRSVVITFDPHPKTVVGKNPDQVRLLTTMEEKQDLINKSGVDVLYVIPFTYDFSRLTSAEFYAQYVVHGIGVREVVVGYDHMFGRDREGGTDELLKLGRQNAFSVLAVQPFLIDGEIVSSTRVRTLLWDGDIETAAKLLGYSYTLEGRVVRGDGRGKTIGFPTANIGAVDPLKVVPANGVYLVGVRVANGDHFGMMNIGVRPTVVAEGQKTLEVHILDFDKSIYDEPVEITFFKRLRDEKKFASVQDLVEQIGADKARTRELLATKQFIYH